MSSGTKAYNGNLIGINIVFLGIFSHKSYCSCRILYRFRMSVWTYGIIYNKCVKSC